MFDRRVPLPGGVPLITAAGAGGGRGVRAGSMGSSLSSRERNKSWRARSYSKVETARANANRLNGIVCATRGAGG